MFKKMMLLVLFLTMFTALSAHAQTGDNGCVIPASGPWPACATGGSSAPASAPNLGGNGCVIPATGPWPPCATGGNPAPTPTPNAGGNGCVIPESGPWPPCATGSNPIPPPTPSPPSTPAPQQPQVREFTVEKTQMALEETNTIHWAVDNVDELWLTIQTYQGNPFSQLVSGTGWFELDLTTIHQCIVGDTEIVLSTSRRITAQTRLAQKEIQISGTEWFWESEQISPSHPVGCSPAQPTQMAHQYFEHGEMIWVEEMDAIIVLFNEAYYEGSGRWVDWYRFTNDYNVGDPEPTGYDVPPTGLSQPIRGFGRIWHEQTLIREILGWATEEEQGYYGLMQSAFSNDDWPELVDGDSSSELYLSSFDNNNVYQLYTRDFFARTTRTWAFGPATIR